MTALAVLAAAFGMVSVQPRPLEAIVADRLTGRPAAVVLIGTVEGSNTQVTRHGPPPADGSTVFDVTGLADVFVGIALADMVANGEITLSDPVARHLPGVAVPTRAGKSISLEDLVMHRSALPRTIPGLTRIEAIGFAAYTRERLDGFLASYELPRDIGERYERSHLGTALLATALAARAAVPLERLLEVRVFVPLKMADTRMEGGVVRSTAADLLKFLAANLDPDLPASSILAETRASRGNVGAPREGLGLGWRIRTEGARQVLWASGAAGGQHAFMALDPSARRGAVVLHNEPLSTDDLGFMALQQMRDAKPVDVATLAAFAGEYEVRRGFTVLVRVEGARLVVRVGTEPESPLTQDSELRFVLDYEEARITFIRDAAGATIGLMLHRGGQHIGARKLR